MGPEVGQIEEAGVHQGGVQPLIGFGCQIEITMIAGYLVQLKCIQGKSDFIKRLFLIVPMIRVDW